MESSTLANCDKHNKGQNEKGEKFRNQNVNYSVKKAKLKGKEEEKAQKPEQERTLKKRGRE